MEYKVTEHMQFLGCNNNESTEREYVMNESQLMSLRQKLESEDFESCNNNTIYCKFDGTYIFRDDNVRAEVDKAITEITNKFNFDSNTKEWEDVRGAMIKAITESSAENLKTDGHLNFYDPEGVLIQIGICDYPEVEHHYIYQKDWFDSDTKTYWDVYVTRKQKKEIMDLRPEMLYEHLKKQIGTQTSDRKKNYFAPKFYVGPFALSLQVNYYLWKYRESNNINHDLPMTEDEFYAVCSNKYSTIDIMVYSVDKDGKLHDIGRAGQISCARLCEYLKEVVMNDETEAWI